jgi:putative hemolysin
MPSNRQQLFSLTALLLLTGGCTAQNAGSGTEPALAENTPGKQLADASVQRCIDDGYTAAPVLRDGIPSSYLCINSETRKKCDSWAYYRGECQLKGSGLSSPSQEQGIKIKEH